MENCPSWKCSQQQQKYKEQRLSRLKVKLSITFSSFGKHNSLSCFIINRKIETTEQVQLRIDYPSDLGFPCHDHDLNCVLEFGAVNDEDMSLPRSICTADLRQAIDRGTSTSSRGLKVLVYRHEHG